LTIVPCAGDRPSRLSRLFQLQCLDNKSFRGDDNRLLRRRIGKLSPAHGIRDIFSFRHLVNVAAIPMIWLQRRLALTRRPRGFHLVTSDVLQTLPELITVSIGLLHAFIQHTSASITINENADSDVRGDLESSLNALAPEDFPYSHTIEGPDDMPAHVKASLMGSSVSIPIADGRLLLGTWQGIYLCEHRNRASSRSLVLTLWGES